MNIKYLQKVINLMKYNVIALSDGN